MNNIESGAKVLFIFLALLLLAFSTIDNRGIAKLPRLSVALYSSWILAMGINLATRKYFFSYQASAILIITMLSYSIGERACGFIFYEKHKSHRLARLTKLVPLRQFITSTIFGISLVCSLAYLMIFASSFGGLVSLFSSGWLIREAIDRGYVNVPYYITLASTLSYSLLPLASGIIIKQGFTKILLLPIIPILVMGITQAARMGTFICIIILLVGFLVRQYIIASVEKKSLLYKLIPVVVATGSLMLSLFAIVYFLRNQGFESSELYSTMTVYASASISSFSQKIISEASQDLGLGMWSFSSIYKTLGLARFTSFGFYDEYTTVSQSGEFTNVYTAFWATIQDFGIIGSTIVWASFGFVSELVRLKSLSLRLNWIAVYISIATLLIYSPIAPMTQHTSLLLMPLASFLIAANLKYGKSEGIAI